MMAFIITRRLGVLGLLACLFVVGCFPSNVTIDLSPAVEQWIEDRRQPESGSVTDRVVMYSRSTCAHSIAMRRQLERERIPFTERAIDTDEEARRALWDKLREADHRGPVDLPVLDVGGELLPRPSFVDVRRHAAATGLTRPEQSIIDFAEPSAVEVELHRLINEYRREHELPAIRLSRSLTHVAQLHAADLDQHPPERPCNMHSWSTNGAWSPCCYTPDHAEAACMWSKPSELTNYPGTGYENSFSAGGGAASPEAALRAWQHSAGHNNVILNRENWERRQWRSLGVGIHGTYAVIWFGEEEDPDGYWK